MGADSMPVDSFRPLREDEEAVDTGLDEFGQKRPAPHGMVDMDLLNMLKERE